MGHWTTDDDGWSKFLTEYRRIEMSHKHWCPAVSVVYPGRCSCGFQKAVNQNTNDYRTSLPLAVDMVDEAAVRDPREKDKPRISLVPPSLILGVAEVFTKGAHGRADFDWLNPPKTYSESLDACERHILTYRQGKTVDEGTGLHPLKHAAARLAMVLEYEAQGLDNNDLYEHQTERQKVYPLSTDNYPHAGGEIRKTLNTLITIHEMKPNDLSAVQIKAIGEAIDALEVLLP